jgi:hypothetical protein|tara:strand:- start:2805 stop:3098 length:294 start_codon:yes stop_codon:yes gene_type:complete
MRNITKEKLEKLGFDYESYVATGNYWEKASIIWVYEENSYGIDFTASGVDEWHMRITPCIQMDVECHKTRPITIMPLKTIEDIVNAYKLITQIDLSK